MKCASQDKIVIGGELVEAFSERAVVDQTTGLVDNDECQNDPGKLLV